MGSLSKEARERWLRQQHQRKSADGEPLDKTQQWEEAKRRNEKVHIHFLASCCVCAQEFAICGLPCFVICPNCQVTLNLRFA